MRQIGVIKKKEGKYQDKKDPKNEGLIEYGFGSRWIMKLDGGNGEKGQSVPEQQQGLARPF